MKLLIAESLGKYIMPHSWLTISKEPLDDLWTTSGQPLTNI